MTVLTLFKGDQLSLYRMAELQVSELKQESQLKQGLADRTTP